MEPFHLRSSRKKTASLPELVNTLLLYEIVMLGRSRLGLPDNVAHRSGISALFYCRHLLTSLPEEKPFVICADKEFFFIAHFSTWMKAQAVAARGCPKVVEVAERPGCHFGQAFRPFLIHFYCC